MEHISGKFRVRPVFSASRKYAPISSRSRSISSRVSVQSTASGVVLIFQPSKIPTLYHAQDTCESSAFVGEPLVTEAAERLNANGSVGRSSLCFSSQNNASTGLTDDSVDMKMLQLHELAESVPSLSRPSSRDTSYRGNGGSARLAEGQKHSKNETVREALPHVYSSATPQKPIKLYGSNMENSYNGDLSSSLHSSHSFAASSFPFHKHAEELRHLPDPANGEWSVVGDSQQDLHCVSPPLSSDMSLRSLDKEDCFSLSDSLEGADASLQDVSFTDRQRPDRPRVRESPCLAEKAPNASGAIMDEKSRRGDGAPIDGAE